MQGFMLCCGRRYRALAKFWVETILQTFERAAFAPPISGAIRT
jgi:hypothetical protein